MNASFTYTIQFDFQIILKQYVFFKTRRCYQFFKSENYDFNRINSCTTMKLPSLSFFQGLIQINFRLLPRHSSFPALSQITINYFSKACVAELYYICLFFIWLISLYPNAYPGSHFFSSQMLTLCSLHIFYLIPSASPKLPI